MFLHDTLLHRLKSGCQTMKYPKGPAPALPERHGGSLRIDIEKCAAGCDACVSVCPTDAITRPAGQPVSLDLGRCLFCSQCVTACPEKAITQTMDHRMAVRARADLKLGGDTGLQELKLAQALDTKLKKLFGRSLKLRQVSAGGCNGCESEINVLNTIVWDIGRFGIQFVASPRHADGLLVTGPVTDNMKLALKKAYDATPDPKIVIAVGACAISGGPFIGSGPHGNGVESLLPVDLFIPGCPPHPLTILDGMLRLLGKLETKQN